MLVLTNALVRFAFELGNAGLIELTDLRTGVRHIQPAPGKPELWQASFQSPRETITLTSTGAPCSATTLHTASSGNQEAQFEWRNLDLGEEKGVVTVRVTVELPPDSGLASWRIWIDNRSATLGLRDIEFPRFNGFLEAGRYDVAFPHRNWGKLWSTCACKLTGDYPTGWSMPVQFCAASREGSGVYMATHDPAAWKKTFTLDPGNGFAIRTYAENMGVPGSGHAAPFPAVVGVFDGSWLEAAKHYREFALTAPWTAEGRLSQRRSTPQAAKDVALWFIVGNTFGPDLSQFAEQDRPLLGAQKHLDVPLAVHWYNWHQIPFDTHYPHYFPAKPGIGEQARDLVSRGVVVMPYINGRIVDKSNADFETYRPFATRNAQGELYEEEYGNGVKQAVMCSATAFWQNHVVEIVDRLGGEVGVNAVYIDQIAAAGPPLCFDPSHGHPLGGGGWWVDGYRQMLRRVQEVAHRAGRDMTITSECVAEPFMDGLDGFLVWQPRDAQDIPLMTAVYAGYSLYFASPEPLKTSDRGWIMIQGRDFLWGCQNGWMGPELLAPEHAAKAAFFKQIGQYRVLGRPFLTYGELVGFINHPETVTEPWATGPATLPIAQGAIWRAEDGSLGVFLVNYLDRDVPLTFTLDPAHYGLAPGRDGYRVRRVDSAGAPVDEAPAAGARPRTETLGPTQIRLLEIRAAGREA
ncbi:MAG: DUF6259 domain-containing protein [Lentisphaerae bacterium]|nr:DUF6259 domain-containing protein [Lentisphaerota bacterium]